MKVYIVGIGVDGCRTLTREAEQAIGSAELLIGAARMLEPFASRGKETVCAYLPDEIAETLRSSGHSTAAVLLSGDCGFFSGAKKLLPCLAEHEVGTIAGISSMSYFCSRLGLSYEQMKCVTLHGKSSNIAIHVRQHPYCFFLLGGETGAGALCRRLCDFGLADVTVHIGTDLGYPSERILTGTAAELADCSADKLSVVITENLRALRTLPSAIEDAAFVRGTVPMTKSEVRGLAVAKMQITSDAVVWDVGCGTGSVSVEAAFRCPDGAVYAFDQKPEAVELTAENARRFGCDSIHVLEGVCPDALADAPAPDSVFIGGSSGNLTGILDAVYAKNPRASLVIAAISLETVQDALNGWKRFGTEPEIIQIAVTRTQRLGSHTMLNAQNPVFLLSGRLS